MVDQPNEMQMETVDDFYTAVLKFNTIGGNLKLAESKAELIARLKNQAERVIEEAQEIIDAETPEDLLDGVIDTLVTAFGCLQMMAPYANTKEAARRICENNLSKFKPNPTELWAADQEEYYDRQDVAINIQNIEYQGVPYGTIRRQLDNKIMKPDDYVPVNLEGLI